MNMTNMQAQRQTDDGTPCVASNMPLSIATAAMLPNNKYNNNNNNNNPSIIIAFIQRHSALYMRIILESPSETVFKSI